MMHNHNAMIGSFFFTTPIINYVIELHILVVVVPGLTEVAHRCAGVYECKMLTTP